MTVAELIDALKEFNPSAEVEMWDGVDWTFVMKVQADTTDPSRAYRVYLR